MSCQHDFRGGPVPDYQFCLQCGTYKSTAPQLNYADNYWSEESGHGLIYHQAYNIDLDIPEGAKCSKAKFILDRIASERGAALEIGCAPGRMLYWLKWAARFQIIIGVEATGDIKIAMDRISANAADRYWFGSFPSPLDFRPSGPYDYILAADVFEHSTEPIPFLAECYRLLKPGGQLFLMLPLADGLPADSRFFAPREHAYLHSRANLQAMLADAGFGDLVLDRWTVGHDTVSARKP